MDAQALMLVRTVCASEQPMRQPIKGVETLLQSMKNQEEHANGKFLNRFLHVPEGEASSVLCAPDSNVASLVLMICVEFLRVCWTLLMVLVLRSNKLCFNSTGAYKPSDGISVALECGSFLGPSKSSHRCFCVAAVVLAVCATSVVCGSCLCGNHAATVPSSQLATRHCTAPLSQCGQYGNRFLTVA